MFVIEVHELSVFLSELWVHAPVYRDVIEEVDGTRVAYLLGTVYEGAAMKESRNDKGGHGTICGYEFVDRRHLGGLIVICRKAQFYAAFRYGIIFFHVGLEYFCCGRVFSEHFAHGLREIKRRKKNE